jgi:hypothetical protein
MMAIFDKQWRGVIALVWLVCSLPIWLLVERCEDPIFLGYFDRWCGLIIWVTTFLLAITGIRHGNIASRICAVLALLVLVSPILFVIIAGYQLSKH